MKLTLIRGRNDVSKRKFSSTEIFTQKGILRIHVLGSYRFPCSVTI